MVICSWERERVIERVVNNTMYREKGDIELHGDTYRLRHRVTQRDRYSGTERYVVSQLDRRERGTQKRWIHCETEWYYIGRQL